MKFNFFCNKFIKKNIRQTQYTCLNPGDVESPGDPTARVRISVVASVAPGCPQKWQEESFFFIHLLLNVHIKP